MAVSSDPGASEVYGYESIQFDTSRSSRTSRDVSSHRCIGFRHNQNDLLTLVRFLF
jgi:hypothetical protein